jgi:hypothetical protein
VGHAFWDIAGVAMTKNNMADKSMSVLDNRYFCVITASPVASAQSNAELA